jgi:small subunit ribosomal protein S6e
MSSEEFTGIKINIAGGKEGAGKGLTKALVLEPTKFNIVGKKVGETFNGALIGLPGYELKITGGSDGAGIPIRKDVHGIVKKHVLLSKAPCFHPTREGMKKRKTVRGNELTDDMVQVNCVVVKYGKEKFFSAPEEKKKAEKKEE